MTPQELQSLRNLGNEAEVAADYIARLLAETSALKRNAVNMAEALLQSVADVEALMAGRGHEGQAMTRPHEILANDLLFAGCYANETEQQAAVRRLKRNEAAALALLALDDEVERLRAEVDTTVADAERYRWLRAHVSGQRKPASGRPAYFSFPGAMILPPLADIMKGSVAQHLDAAIDAAIEGEP